MNNQTLVGAVKTAKRTSCYRRHRALLASVVPSDVWADQDFEIAVVTFSFADNLKELCFGIRTSTSSIEHVGIVGFSASEEGWQVVNEGLEEAGAAN